MAAKDFEKLGLFYLGRVVDPQQGRLLDELLLYDAKDLTTHGVCVGMTGSGKTGLCLALLEEAAIDGIPAIAVDPKGDLGNLLLTFPQLRPEDFLPWVEAEEAARKGITIEAHAQESARRWQAGLAEWGQDGARIARLREAAEVAIYTPGSNAGLPLTVLRSFEPPSAAILDDADAMRERVMSVVTGLLALLGIEGDPVNSREHILLAKILDQAWTAGAELDLTTLIRQIQAPPFDMVGVFNLEQFFPIKDRMALAMRVNNLMASPGFAGWMEGEPLDVGRLLYTAEGKPRIAILSIAHLSDAERMFFVTILLNEVLSWARRQPGTSSLRALFFMDEIFGYFPPTAEPPSKRPMLTLLKQARAFGLGVLLATQNPVDLDYKGLGNTGTWFIGRLQSERDKMRVLDGLESASTTSGVRFDRRTLDGILSGLGGRQFLMHNVHDQGPTLFQTRWCLSYLRGPLTRQQIQSLTAAGKAFGRRAAAIAVAKAPTAAPLGASDAAPVLPPQIPQYFVGLREAAGSNHRLVFRPCVYGAAQLHYVHPRSKTDIWYNRGFLIPFAAVGGDLDWPQSRSGEVQEMALLPEAPAQGEYEALPAAGTSAKQYAAWGKTLQEHVYRNCPLTLCHCPSLKEWSRAGEREGEFRGRLVHLVREQRDLAVEKARAQFAKSFATAQDRVRRAEERCARNSDHVRREKVHTALSFGAVLLGAVLGRKVASAGNIGRAVTTANRAQRSVARKGELERAEQGLALEQDRLAQLEADFQKALQKVEAEYHPDQLTITAEAVAPRKADIRIEEMGLAWTPWRVASSGIAEPLGLALK